MASIGCPHEHKLFGSRCDPKPELGRLNEWANVTPEHIAVYFEDETYTIIERIEWEKLCVEHIMLTKDNFQPFSTRSDRDCVRFRTDPLQDGGLFSARLLGVEKQLVAHIDKKPLHNCKQNLKVVTGRPVLGCGHVHLIRSEWKPADKEAGYYHPFRFMDPQHVELQLPNVPPVLLAQEDWHNLAKQHAELIAVETNPMHPCPEQRFTIQYCFHLDSVARGEVMEYLLALPERLRAISIDGNRFHLCLDNWIKGIRNSENILRLSKTAKTGYRGIYLDYPGKPPTSWRLEYRTKDHKLHQQRIPIPGFADAVPLPEYVKIAYVEFVEILRKAEYEEMAIAHVLSETRIAESKDRMIRARIKHASLTALQDQARDTTHSGHQTGIRGITIQRETRDYRTKKVGTPTDWKIQCRMGGNSHWELIKIPENTPEFPVPPYVIERNAKIREAMREGLPWDTYL